MARHYGSSVWEGDLKNGKGRMQPGKGGQEFDYTAGSRFEEKGAYSPEEMIAAAHTGCFSMALSADLAGAGHSPKKIQTSAEVIIEKKGDGFKITRIRLTTKGQVPGIDEKTFKDFAEQAKKNCPVSVALAGVDQVEVEASLIPS